MLCYKDRTFCQYWGDCVEGEGCEDALTQKIKDGAIRTNLNISQHTGMPGCFKKGDK